MKNAMKKLMSLVLVAILLVSAVPFAASAATYPVTIYQMVDGTDVVTTGEFETEAERVAVAEICAANSITEDEFEGAWCTTTDEYRKDYGEDLPVTATNVKIRKKAIATCGDCGEVYIVENGHDCPEADVAPITIVVKVDSSDNVVWQGTKEPSNGEYALVKNLLSYCWNSSWTDVYEFSHAYRYANDGTKGQSENQDLAVYAGEEVHIMLKTKTVPETTTPTETTNPNGVNDYFSDEAMSPVWLYIYTNNNLSTPTKMVNITNYTITGNTLTKAEILSVIDDYYKAADANTGIIWKGMYMEYDSTNTSSLDVLQWVQGQNLTDELTGLKAARMKGTVIVMARVTGVTNVSTSTADSTNYKTGDTIFAPIFVLGLSASALAVMFYLNKKRAV